MFKKILAAGLLGLASFAPLSQATTVQFQTSMGNFEVNLYDEESPATVANFLAYVSAEDYNNSFMHRLIGGFIVQGGGYIYNPENGAVTSVPANSPIINEAKYSNVRGTIAMAKLGGNPNSATSEWFINLGNNSENLDRQNGGFTVFGVVTGDGMDVVDAIAALPVLYWAQGHPAATDLPVQNYTQEDYDNNVPVVQENLVVIESIVVLDAATDTAGEIQTPIISTKISGGGIEYGFLLLLSLGALISRFYRS